MEHLRGDGRSDVQGLTGYATPGVRRGPLYNTYDIQRKIRPMRVHYVSSTASTNQLAVQLRRSEQLYPPVVVLAEEQTDGVGRGNHKWWSSSGSVAATFCFANPNDERLHELPLVAGLAVRAALSELCPNATLQVKWPNDVLHEGRKLSGLLCEHHSDAAIIGVGVNVNIDPADAPESIGGGKVQDRMCSLLSINGKPCERDRVVIALAVHLQAYLRRRDEQTFQAFINEYDVHHALIGQRIAVDAGDRQVVHGLCTGVDSLGRLLVQDGPYQHAIISGQVL